MNCLASEWGNGYHNYDVYFELIITEPGKASYTIYPFGRNVAATSHLGVFRMFLLGLPLWQRPLTRKIPIEKEP